MSPIRNISKSARIFIAVFCTTIAGWAVFRGFRINSQRTSVSPVIPRVPMTLKTGSSANALGPLQEDRVELGFRLFAELSGKPKPQIVEYLASLGHAERAMLLRRLLLSAKGEARDRQLRELFTAWATVDAVEAFTAARTLVSQQEQESAENDVFSEAAPSTASALLNALDNEHGISPRQYQTLASKALAKLSKVDADAAVSYIDAHPNTNFALQAVMDVATDLGKAKGSAAMKWATLKADQYGSAVQQGSIVGWSNTDMKGAIKYLSDVNDPTLHMQLGSLLMNHLARDDPAAAIEWTRQIPDPAERGVLYMMIAASAADKDPTSAATWAFSLPPGERADAISAVASGWATKNSDQAAAWVQSLSPGSDRDAATLSLSYALVSNSPAEGLNWALQVSDPTRRTDAFLNIYGTWKNRDPISAGEWLRTAPLPPDLKNYIQNPTSSTN